MPLFTFVCLDCEHEIELFFHNPKAIEDAEIVCTECDSKNCERRFANCGNRVWLEAKDFYNQKIKPDAERIVKEIDSNSDKDFFDICGDN